MKKLLLLGLLGLFGISSAFAQKTTSHFRNAQSRAGDAVTQIVVKPTIVEAQVMANVGRISKVCELSKEETEIAMGGDLNNLRAWATYLACEEYKADVIMGATYRIESHPIDAKDPIKEGYQITVTGFPAKFVNWHTATDAEYKWVELYQRSGRSTTSVAPIVKNTAK